MQNQFTSLKTSAALLIAFFCLFQSTLYEMGSLAEQREQKTTAQPPGLLPVAETNFESTSIPQEQRKTATNDPQNAVKKDFV